MTREIALSTRTAAAIFILTAGVPLTPAQQVPVASTPSAHVVHLDVAVRDGGDRPVAGLGESDFTLMDNKAAHPIQKFAYVEQEKQPASVLIVIDAVNAPASAVSYQRDQLVKFLRSNDGHLAYPTSIAILTDQNVRSNRQASTNGNELADGLAKADIGLRIIRRDSGFYGAQDRMTLSLNALQQMLATQEKLPGRKLMIWVSPGWPLISGAEVNLTDKERKNIFEQVMHISTELRENRITLYNVNTWGATESVGRALYYQDFVKGVTKSSQTDLADLGLQVLAEQTGGLVQNSNDLGIMLRKCQQDAGAHYELSFDVPAADESVEYHAVEVRVDKPGVTARTRQGYYTTP
jgi:VWFA-related protein